MSESCNDKPHSFVIRNEIRGVHAIPQDKSGNMLPV
jgi:hypothetical protein